MRFLRFARGELRLATSRIPLTIVVAASLGAAVWALSLWMTGHRAPYLR